jgi:hypothetical protein
MTYGFIKKRRCVSDDGMAERLANVIYWLGCIFAALFLIIGSAAGVSGNHPRRQAS